MSLKAEKAKNLRKFGEKEYDSMAAFARALAMEPTDLNKYLSAKIGIGPNMMGKLEKLGCTETYLVSGLTREELNDKFAKSQQKQADEALKRENTELKEENKLLKQENEVFRNSLAPTLVETILAQLHAVKKGKHK